MKVDAEFRESALLHLAYPARYLETFLYIVNILINVLSEEKVMGCYGVRLGQDRVWDSIRAGWRLNHTTSLQCAFNFF